MPSAHATDRPHRGLLLPATWHLPWLLPQVLFCLCESSGEYLQMAHSYSRTLAWTGLPFTWAPVLLFMVLPLTLCLCMCCPIFYKVTDISKYYDKDLL